MINCSNLISEIGNVLSKRYPFVVMYFDTPSIRKFELRSSSVDVSEIAKLHGGGGHKFAAGFRVKKSISLLKEKGLWFGEE